MDSDMGTRGLVNYVDEVLGQCGTCRPVDRVPNIPIAGASTVSASNEKLQEGLLFYDGAVALHATDVYAKNLLLTPVRANDPQEVRGAFRSSRTAFFGKPNRIQMEKGGN